MANTDVRNDIAPKQGFTKPSLPTIAALRTALKAAKPSSYTDDRLNTMTRNDMLYAVRVEGVTVTGL